MKDGLVDTIGATIINMIEGVHGIVAERDSRNEQGQSLPPVMPHRLRHVRGREFSDIVRQQLERLRSRWTANDIDQIELEFSRFLAVVRGEEMLRAALENCDNQTTFEQGWSLLGKRFPLLEKFCGGLASVFPGTSSVESDFSVVKWEKDDNRIALTDFSLEGGRKMTIALL